MELEKTHPPKLAHRFFRWYCHPKLLKYIEGDLLEMYEETKAQRGKRQADLKFIMDVILLFRPGIIRPAEGSQKINTYGMYKNYVKVGWRNLAKDKGYSFINIGGLALGMAVAILIGLWVWDELSFNKQHENYDRIAAVMQNLTYGDNVETMSSQSLQLGSELRTNYASHFRYVTMSSMTQRPVLSYRDKNIVKTGYFMEPDAPEMLSFQMIKGKRDALRGKNSILLSESTAVSLFGSNDAVGETIKLDNRHEVTVAGVFEDIPPSSSFSDLLFVAPLELLINEGNRNLGWANNWLEVYVQLTETSNMESASLAIRDAKLKNVDAGLARFKPELFLFPLSKWRLYANFENGVNTGGRIEFVWLFGTIGGIVLLLACINFMNLSTARAENRAKEVGVRKVIGSRRSQLISQFFTESFLMVLLAFLVSVLLSQLALPWFNEITGKTVTIDWANRWMWLGALCTVLLTSVVAASYPSFYLSGFAPARVLKGTFRSGRFSAIPRKILIVTQFATSVALVIATTVVYQQVEHARQRPLGYQRSGLVFIPMKTPEVKKNYTVLRNEVLATGVVSNMSKSECVVTDMYWSDGDLQWRGKNPDMQDIMYRGAVDFDFGKTVGWRIAAGRDFSPLYASDSTAMILNKAAVAYMGLKNPLGETVKRYGQNYTVIGVVDDMVSQSLYKPAAQTYYIIDPFNFSQVINVKLNPALSVNESLQVIERVFHKLHPDVPFEFQFADEKVADKFAYEARVGSLVGIFAILAIVISCMGLFGLAAFLASKRTKEIGIRKVVGASVSSLWRLLSRDFLVLVIISCAVAVPFAYYFMENWLQQFDYRTTISGWLILGTCISAVFITVATVSYEAIKAAMANPVNSLRSE